jgi:hypothetical protein
MKVINHDVLLILFWLWKINPSPFKPGFPEAFRQAQDDIDDFIGQNLLA